MSNEIKKQTNGNAIHSPLTQNFSFDVQEHVLDKAANALLEAGNQRDWASVLRVSLTMTHQSFARGFFALATTLKKIRWSLVLHHDVKSAEKYLLRVLWLLADSRRKNDVRPLIHRNVDRYEIKKRGDCESRTIRLHNFDPDSDVPSLHDVETAMPHIAGLLNRLQDETNAHATLSGSSEHYPEHHIFQHPHVSFRKISHAPIRSTKDLSNEMRDEKKFADQ